jgi:type IV pilus assembly protein PilM
MAFSLKKVFGSIKSNPALAQSAVGIDIGRGSVKVVELERTEDGPVLKTYGEIQIAPYADAPIGTTVDFDAGMLEKVIVDVFREAGVSAQHGVLALPLSAGFVTVIELVAEPDENLESRIPVEARKYVPIPLKEITLDWTVVGTPTELENKKVQYRVLLVALPNETLVQYTNLLSSIELAHQPMELAVFSTVRCLPLAQQTDTVAVLDMGASVAKLAIYQAGTLTAIHRFTAGGAAVTSKLAELLQIDVAAAEELKRSGGITGEHEADIRRITAAVYDSSLQEVRRIIQHYETVNGLESIPVLLAGGMGSLTGMQTYVSDVMQRPVESIFPFAVVGYPAFMEDVLRTIGPTFASSVGAALRHLQ